jgi:peptidoglycan/xylan/chitin deacetylase (PgdA/CDA1 family)
VALHARGHEIACHSFTHKRVDYIDGNGLVSEILRNRAALKAVEPSLPLRNFAYPYGFSSLSWKRKLREFFDTSRTAHPCVNTGTVDPQYLGSIPLIEGEMDSNGIERAFDTAQENNGWTIFYGHDVADQCSPYGCTPALLKQALRIAQRRGITIAPVQSCWNILNAQPQADLPATALAHSR